MSQNYGRVGIHLFQEVMKLIQTHWDDHTAGLIEGGKLQAGGIAGTIPAGTLPGHHATHETGGTDALVNNLDANARLAVLLDGALIGKRRGVNFVTGAGVTLAVVDDGPDERVNVTITATGGGTAPAVELLVAGDPPQPVTASDGDFVYARR